MVLAGHRELSLGGTGTSVLVSSPGSEFEDSAMSHFFSLNTLTSLVCPPGGFTFWQKQCSLFSFSFFK